MGLVVHAYRLTSPLGSPRSFAAHGYTGIQFATTETCANDVLPMHKADDAEQRRAERASQERAEAELLAAENAILIE